MLGKDEEKDYVVYRYNNESGRVYQCHKWTWEGWESFNNTKNKTKLVDNVTQNEARGFCQLTRED